MLQTYQNKPLYTPIYPKHTKVLCFTDGYDCSREVISELYNILLRALSIQYNTCQALTPGLNVSKSKED